MSVSGSQSLLLPLWSVFTEYPQQKCQGSRSLFRHGPLPLRRDLSGWPHNLFIFGPSFLAAAVPRLSACSGHRLRLFGRVSLLGRRL